LLSKYLIFGVILLLLPVYSCKDNNDGEIPYVHVDFQIDILSSFYPELSNVGGWVYLTGGYKGIVVYRLSMEEFLAYDRCCSYQPRVSCEIVDVEESGLTMKCPCCNSRFLILDGTVIEGPATQILRQYRTFFDGQYLSVFN